MGLKNIMPTIIIGKIEIELPAIHMMKKFIGICFKGPRAMSHDLCRNKHILFSPGYNLRLKISKDTI
jgi:hypothetical protein